MSCTSSNCIMYWQVLHLHLMESPPQKKTLNCCKFWGAETDTHPHLVMRKQWVQMFLSGSYFQKSLMEKKNRFSLLFSITKQHIGSKCLMKALRQTSSTSKLFFIYEDSYSAGLRELFIDTELLSIQHCCHCLIFFVLFVVLQKGLLSFYCVVSKCRCVNEGTFQCCWPVDKLS